MSKLLPFIFGGVLACLVLFGGLTLMVNDGADKWAATIADVPESILIGGTVEENGAIIEGYIDGRDDASAGKIPLASPIPQSYYHGYCHGYADNSALSFTDAFNLSSDNAFNVYWEDVNHD